jgi:hypothetical protein
MANGFPPATELTAFRRISNDMNLERSVHSGKPTERNPATKKAGVSKSVRMTQTGRILRTNLEGFSFRSFRAAPILIASSTTKETDMTRQHRNTPSVSALSALARLLEQGPYKTGVVESPRGNPAQDQDAMSILVQPQEEVPGGTKRRHTLVIHGYFGIYAESSLIDRTLSVVINGTVVDRVKIRPGSEEDMWWAEYAVPIRAVTYRLNVA